MRKTQKPTRTKLERETIILFNEAEDNASIGTTSKSVYRKMVRRFGEPTRVLGPESWSWTVDKGCIPLPRRRRKKVVVSAPPA
jgi:hypothetical protein